jgi:hypothetical protein
MKAHAEAPVPPIRERRPDVPEELAAVLARMLAKDPAERYATPGEVAVALQRFAAAGHTEEVDRRLPAVDSRKTRGGISSTGFLFTVCFRFIRNRLSLVALLAGLSALIFFVVWGKLGGVPRPVGQKSPPGAAENVDRAKPLQGSMRISHYRGEPSISLGDIGRQSFAARFNDDVRIQVSLGELASCYLIAFNANGTVQLCWPEEEGASPPRNDGFAYPSDSKKCFRLNDGIGMQAFVLLVSRHPLPTYPEWRQRIGSAAWKQLQGEGAWEFDGQETRPLVPRDRGQVVERKRLGNVSQPLLESFFNERSGADAVRIVAFPVKP